MGRGVQLKFDIKNVKVVRKGLQNLWRKIPLVGRKNIWDFMVRLLRRMKIYPAQRPQQKYVRTFKFRRGWQVQKVGPTGYMIINRTPYTKYVVGNAYGGGQAWMHAGRWTTLRDAADKLLANLPQAIHKNLRTVARREGFRTN